MKKRWLEQSLDSWKNQKSLRGLILCGARQVGKTTLARYSCADMEYLNLDNPIFHVEFENMGGEEFSTSYSSAVLDEVQKVPVLFDLVKYAIDSTSQNRYLLLGSAQILLLKKIRESLAGRAMVRTLHPLAFCERLSNAPKPWIAMALNLFARKEKIEIPSRKWIRVAESQWLQEWKTHLAWGGMPAQFEAQGEEEWTEWLSNYVSIYLQRDLRDLARIHDLAPFRKCERMLALRTGSLLNYSELARDTGVSVQTAKNYCHYLELSFQTILAQPYFGNPSKRLVKSPKVYMLDVGVQRVLSGQWGPLSGRQYEGIIASELVKMLSHFHAGWDLYHIRTFDNLEVDFFITNGERGIALEVKQSDRVHPHDARHLKKVESVTGISPILKFVVYEGREISQLDSDIWGIPAFIFFGPETG